MSLTAAIQFGASLAQMAETFSSLGADVDRTAAALNALSAARSRALDHRDVLAGGQCPGCGLEPAGCVCFADAAPGVRGIALGGLRK